jgi:hypothetical protein
MLGSPNPVTLRPGSSTLESDGVQLEPVLQAKLDRIARETAADLVHDAVASYVDDLTGARQMLDSRYDDIESGKAKRIDGEEAFGRSRANLDERRNG